MVPYRPMGSHEAMELRDHPRVIGCHRWPSGLCMAQFPLSRLVINALRNVFFKVRRDQFLNVLRQHGFKLENNYLDAFMERCDMHAAKNSSLISYVEFLEKFQNRSDQGLAYRLIAGGSDLNDSENSSNIGQVERRLLKLFQNDFLTLLQIFRKIDRSKSNMITKQEFRAAIESHFAIELSDGEFEEFLSHVPKDGNRIKYLEFMTKFDSDSSSTLFDSESVK